MESLTNYRQTALEQFNELIVLSQSSGNIDPATDTEIWTIQILLGVLVMLVYWSLLED